jgi:predicted DsbA family dithiol-disulfide isomerase
VVAEVEEAYRIGVSGVPCFIIDRRYAVVGAHPAETLVEAISQAVAARGAEAATSS